MAQKTIPLKVKKEVNKYIHHLKNNGLPITQAIVFGSYSKGKQHAWSDIDLCIVSNTFKDPFSAMQYLWSNRLADTGLTIEPIGFNEKDFKKGGALVDEVKKYGIRIV